MNPVSGSDAIVVSIICCTYNHENYIRDCLEGFVSQRTGFGFEVLIHDDASTDGTAGIIREYESRYPEIIRPVYQQTNQYSKGVDIFLMLCCRWRRVNTLRYARAMITGLIL